MARRQRQTGNQTATSPADQIADIEAQLATCTQQLRTAHAGRPNLEAQLDEARARRDADRVPALAEGDAVARERYIAATSDVRDYADKLEESGALIAQLASKREQLEAQLLAAKQDQARAAIAGLSAQRVPAAADLDQAERLTESAMTRLHDLDIRAREIAVTGGLPESEIEKLYRLHRAHIRKIQWELGTLRILQRPLSGRYLADLSHVDIEQGGPSVEVDGDTDDTQAAGDAA